MVDEQLLSLTPDEAGAFVAQWAETNKIGAAELAERLGVDDSKAASLMRQAKGRLSMERWAQGQQPKNIAWRSALLPLIGAFAIGGGVGAFAVGYLMPIRDAGDVAAHPLPHSIQVSTSDPPGRPPLTEAKAIANANAQAKPKAQQPKTDVSPLMLHQGGARAAIAAAQTGRMSMSPKTLRIPGPPSAVHPQHGAMPGPAHPHDNSLTEMSQVIPGRIAPNLIVTLITSDANYIVRGKSTKDYVSAKYVRDEDIREAVQTMLAYMAKQDLTPASSERMRDGRGTAQVYVRVGRAVAEADIPWSVPARLAILRLIENVSGPMYTKLASSVLKQIRDAGPTLFAPESVHAIGP